MSMEKVKSFVVNHKALSITMAVTATGFIAYKCGTHHPKFWLFKKGSVQIGVGDDDLMLTLFNRKSAVGMTLTPEQAKQISEAVNEGLEMLNSEI